MILPSITIHTVVNQSKKLMEKKGLMTNKMAKLTPVALGMSLIPLFPYIFDSPVEYLINYANKCIPNK